MPFNPCGSLETFGFQILEAFQKYINKYIYIYISIYKRTTLSREVETSTKHLSLYMPAWDTVAKHANHQPGQTTATVNTYNLYICTLSFHRIQLTLVGIHPT